MFQSFLPLFQDVLPVYCTEGAPRGGLFIHLAFPFLCALSIGSQMISCRLARPQKSCSKSGCDEEADALEFFKSCFRHAELAPLRSWDELYHCCFANLSGKIATTNLDHRQSTSTSTSFSQLTLPHPFHYNSAVAKHHKMAMAFESSLSASSMRPPLSSAAAPSMVDALPNINFGFEDLRNRMAQFTVRFDAFIEKGRKRVLEERNQFRINMAELEGTSGSHSHSHSTS